MTELDRGDFATLMLGIGETYGEPVSDARMEIYFAALEDLDLCAIRAAANIHVRLQKFFPRPAELREAVTGSAEDRADLAWPTVARIVRAFGYYNPPPDDAWHDEATRRAALELFGGWQALCSSLPAEGPEMLGVAKLFKATYRAYANEAQRGGRELTAGEARAALSNVKVNLQKRGLPTHGL